MPRSAVPSAATVGAFLINISTTANNLTVSWAVGLPSALTIAGGVYIGTGSGTGNILFGTPAGEDLTLAPPSAPYTGETFVTVDKTGSSNRFTPNILGSGSLVTNGSGAVIFDNTQSGTNYTGGLTLNSGSTSVINNTASFGSGPITLTGGIFLPNSITYTIANPINLNGVVTIQSGAAASAFVFTGPVTLSTNVVLTGNISGGAAPLNTIASFNGQVSGPVRRLSQGRGRTARSIALNNVNTYTGGTTARRRHP